MRLRIAAACAALLLGGCLDAELKTEEPALDEPALAAALAYDEFPV